MGSLLASLLVHSVLLFGDEWSSYLLRPYSTQASSLNASLVQRHVNVKPAPAAGEHGAKAPRQHSSPYQRDAPSGSPVLRGQKALVESVEEDDVAPASLSEYRLAIARRARRYKVYPAQAREGGVAGEVGISVLAAHAGAPIQVRLEQSSGDALLDEAAMSMIGQATRDAPLPAELQNRSWRISVPLQFSLDG